MLRLLLKLLSFVTGQRLLTPEQAASQQLELNDLRSKQTALESLSSQLRSEMKRQQALAREQLKETQKSHEQMLLAQQSEIDSLKEALGQLNLSVDIETQRQMKENNDLLSQLNWLSGTIAHDFRAPLRAIDAYSFFLADDLGENAPPEASKSLEEIRRNGKRMGVLLDALIEYLRLGVCPLNVQLHDLNETLLQVVNEHFDFSPVPIEIQVLGKWRFDKPMMMKAFKELLDNAVKFSKPVESPRVDSLPARYSNNTDSKSGETMAKRDKPPLKLPPGTFGPPPRALTLFNFIFAFAKIVWILVVSIVIP